MNLSHDFKEGLGAVRKWAWLEHQPLDFEQVQEEEVSGLLARRKLQKDRNCLTKFPADYDDIRKDSVGVCLSGGGVRSATFNLGVLQALDEHDLLPRVDYLSTVSGGGYIGSALAWFQYKDAADHRFPFRRGIEGRGESDSSGESGEASEADEDFDDDTTKSQANIEWIRRHASYLTPGDGLNAWALIAAVARGTFVNLLIAVPILFWLIFYMSKPWDLAEGQPMATDGGPLLTFMTQISPLTNWIDSFIWPWVALAYDSGIGFGFLLLASLVLFAYLIARFLLYAFVSRLLSSKWTPQTFAEHRDSSVQSGMVLKFAALFLLLGLVPFVRDGFTALIDAVQWDAQAVTVVTSAIGVISIVIGWITRGDKKETAGWRSYLIKFGLLILVYGLLLWFHYYSDNIWSNPEIERSGPSGIHAKLGYIVAFSLLLGISANINRVSMHRYYRNRLLECYMPDNPPLPGRRPVSDQDWDADRFPIRNVDPATTGTPCLIINTNLTTLNSDVPRYRIRGGHSFVFTPWHIGSDAISTDADETKGWVRNGSYREGRTNLGTVLSVSGAAVDPNTGATRSAPLAFIMAFLNVRLGYWLRNPMRPPLRLAAWNESPFLWHYYAYREMIGWRLKETHNFIHLSDGGHFENLGLYELIRRKCRYILVSDAGADPDFKFKDLGRIVELAREDFQADIDIGTKALMPDGTPRTSSRAVVAGTIIYNDGSTGKLLYLKATVCAKLPKDIDSYHNAKKTFPHETTIDQFFGDRQFEAYRELGYRLAAGIFGINSKRPSTLNELFEMESSTGSSKEAEIADVAQQILKYVSVHPQAADNVEGISKFWLQLAGAAAARESVERALETLVAGGDIKMMQNSDGSVIYGRSSA